MEFDCIIAGAGPAGLALASVLSPKHRVCVIDRGEIGTTSKSWASFRDLVGSLGLGDSIANSRIDKLEFGHYLGAKWVFTDTYCQLDERKLLGALIARSPNATFVSNFEVQGFSRDGQRVSVRGGGETYEAPLLIDCLGADSPIVREARLVSTYSSYPILGVTVDNVSFDPTKFVWEIMRTPDFDGLMIGGIMPYSEDRVQVHVFPYLDNSRMACEDLEKYLSEYLAYYPSLKDARVVCKTQGTILMGELKQDALDNVFFFGESGLWTPRFIGTGLNQILRDFGTVGNRLSELLESGRLSAADLSQVRFATMSKKSTHFLKCFEKIIFSLKDDPEKLNGFLQKINEAHPRFGECLMRNAFDAEILMKSWQKIHEHYSIAEITRILSKKDVLYLVEMGLEILEDSVLEKYRSHLA